MYRGVEYSRGGVFSTTGRRAFAIWLICFAAYLATIGLKDIPQGEFTGDEPHYLLAAHSLAQDGDFDVVNNYRDRDYESYYSLELEMHGSPSNGVLREPHGIGFPLLIAPAFAVDGAAAVTVFLAMLSALVIAMAYLLARRVVEDRWAWSAALVAGLSPPMLAYSTAVYPEMSAAALLCAGMLFALDGRIALTGLAMGLLPWLGTKYVPAGVVILAFLVWRLGGPGRLGGRVRKYGATLPPYLRKEPLGAEGRWRVAATLVVAMALVGLAYVGVNELLYDSPTPYNERFRSGSATEAAFPGGYLDRSYRVGALWLDRTYGLLRWAPIFALTLIGLWLLLTSFTRRRSIDGSRTQPARAEGRTVLMLATGVFGAQFAVAAFLAPTMFSFAFPPRHLIAGLPAAGCLVALGWRRLPRTGALLGGLSLLASAWLYIELRFGGAEWINNKSEAPWGPLVDLWPYYELGSVLPFVVTGVLGVVLMAVLLREVRHWRHIAGITRRA